MRQSKVPPCWGVPWVGAPLLGGTPGGCPLARGTQGGCPPAWTLDGVPPQTWDRVGPGMGYPPISWMGYPLPRDVNWQTNWKYNLLSYYVRGRLNIIMLQFSWLNATVISFSVVEIILNIWFSMEHFWGSLCSPRCVRTGFTAPSPLRLCCLDSTNNRYILLLGFEQNMLDRYCVVFTWGSWI